MATAEQNTLLAQQLFAPVGQQIQHNAEEKTQLLLRLAEIQNQERFQQQMAAQQQAASQQMAAQQQAASQQMASQQQANSMQLENLRAQNSRALAADAETRQLAVTKQQQDAIDQRDLNKNFALSYPIYAQAASVLGKTPKPISEFEQSWEGLGELQGEMADLREQASKHEKTEAAKGVVAVLDQATSQLKDAIAARNDGLKITAQDQSTAKSYGLKALQQAATTGAIPGLDPSSKKFQSGIEALSGDVPDLTVAQQTLGPAAMQVYNSGVQQGLMALTNDKDRIAKINALSRDVQAAQRGASDSLTRLMSLAATNPELGGMLQDRSKALNAINTQAETPPSVPDTQSVFAKLVGSPAQTAQPSIASGQSPINTMGNPALAAYSQQAQAEQANRLQQQRQAQLQAVMQRLTALRQQATDQGTQLNTARPTPGPANIGFGYGAMPAPYTVDPRPQLAQQLQSTLGQQQQAQTELETLRRYLGNTTTPSTQTPIFQPSIAPAPISLQPQAPNLTVPNYLLNSESQPAPTQ